MHGTHENILSHANIESTLTQQPSENSSLSILILLQLSKPVTLFRLHHNRNLISHQLPHSLRSNQSLHPILLLLLLFHHQIEMTTLSYLPITLTLMDQMQSSNHS